MDRLFVLKELQEEELDALKLDLVDLAVELMDLDVYQKEARVPMRMLQLLLHGYWIHKKEVDEDG